MFQSEDCTAWRIRNKKTDNAGFFSFRVFFKEKTETFREYFRLLKLERVCNWPI